MGIPKILKHLKNEALLKQKDVHLEDCRNSTVQFIMQKDIQLQDLRDSHINLVMQKDRHIEELHETIKQLYRCIVIQAIVAALIVIALVVVTCYLLGIRDEEKRRLEAQNFKYDEMIRTKISHLEKELEREREKQQQQLQQQQQQQLQLQNNQQAFFAQQPQQSMLYAFPALAPSPTAVKI